MLPRSFVVPGPIQKRDLTKLIVCRSGIADKLCKSVVPNCLPYLPSNTSRLILISACSASYLVRASGIGPRYLWFPKSYHHSLPLFLTVKEHHLRSRLQPQRLSGIVPELFLFPNSFLVPGPFDNLLKVEAQQVTYLAIGDTALRLHHVKSVYLDPQELGTLFWCHQGWS